MAPFDQFKTFGKPVFDGLTVQHHDYQIAKFRLHKRCQARTSRICYSGFYALETLAQQFIRVYPSREIKGK
jgi:hypothetical protein